MHHSILLEIVILLSISVFCVAFFRRWNLPPVLAYLLVGILVGPHNWGWVSDSENTRFLAEFGVVFLMFTVGLEFSFPQLVAMRKEVFGVGAAQVGLTTLVVLLILVAIGEPLSAAFIVGGVIALSSTAIVIKQLNEQMETHSRHGKLSIAILIFQDLAVIPFLIIIPALSINSDGNLATELAFAVIKGIFVIGIMLALGRWLLRPLFQQIAKLHSSELFTLTVLLFSVAAAWITDFAGLSLALGAFVAGMMLAETEFKHQVEVDIRPFRDVLLGLFFVTIGMLLNLTALVELLPWVAMSVISIITLKVMIIMMIGHFAGIEKGVTSRAALTLAQGGEFGFALLAIALSNDILSEGLSQIVLASVIISMVISPFIIKNNGYFAKRWFADSYLRSRVENIQNIQEETTNIEGHVIICGYGRIGQNIARLLKQEDINYIAIDLDPVTVKEAHDAGEPVFYGDSTHAAILKAANIISARVVVISYNDFNAATLIIQHTKKLRPEIPILVRTRDDTHLTELQNIGATEVVPETLEASLTLASHLLMLLEVPAQRVTNIVKNIRESRYQLLHEFFHGQSAMDVSDPDVSRQGLHSFVVPNRAYCIGKQIESLKLDRIEVVITALRHDGICHQKPDAGSVIRSGDVLVFYANPERSAQAERFLLTGEIEKR